MKPQTSIALMKFLSGVARRLGVGEHVYVVGGAVRNFVIQQPIKDIDVVIDSVALGGKDSEWFAKQLQRAIPVDTNLTTNNYGVAILTVRGDWEIGGQNLAGEVIEIANARTESYADNTYKPDTVAPASITEDTYRREFTFNTLLWRLHDLADGPDKAPILDLTGCGLQDLKDGTMRCPSNPDKTFGDDPSRMIRAIKFLLKYGFKIDSEVTASIRRNKEKLRNVPPGHLSNMIITLFYETGVGKRALVEMDKLGLLDVVKSIAQTERPFRDALANWAERKADLAFLFDLMDLGMPVGRRLGFLNPAQKDRVREITVQMDAAEGEVFVDVLEQPGKVLDMPALIEEFGLKGAEIKGLMETARTALLDDPILAASKTRWSAIIRDSFARKGRTAGIFQAPPVMQAAIEKWMLSVYCGHVLAQIEKRMEGRQDALAVAKKALIEMQQAERDLEANVAKMQPGDTLKITLYKLGNDGELVSSVIGLRAVTNRYLSKDGIQHYPYGGVDKIPEGAQALFQYAESSTRLLFREGGEAYVAKRLVPKLFVKISDAVQRVYMRVKFLESQQGNLKTMGNTLSLERLEVMRKLCLQHTTKAKTYAAKAGRDFPVDLTGWKYVQPGSKVIATANAEIDKHNKRLRDDIQYAEEAFEAAKTYWEANRARVKHEGREDLAFAERDAAKRLVSFDGHRNYWTVYRLSLGERPTEALINRNLGGFEDNWIPVSKVEFLDPIGKDDVNAALARQGWSKITAILDFKGHTARGGIWISLTRELQVDVHKAEPLDLVDLEDGIFQIQRITRHEMQHVGQDLLRVVNGLGEDAGLPSKNIRDPKFDPSGVKTQQKGRRYDPTRKDHALRDVEFYTRLADEIETFVRDTRRDPNRGWSKPILNWTTQREFFKRLKVNEPLKWKKAVSEFVKGVEERLRTLGSKERVARRFLAKTFTINEGAPIFYGKYKNKRGIIKEFGVSDRGDPTVTIEPVPKGRKQEKVLTLFKIREDGGQAPGGPVPGSAADLAKNGPVVVAMTKRVASLYLRTARKDKFPGGLGDKAQPEDFDADQVAKGKKVELEHTNDPDMALEIALDHLTEDPKYYDKLEKMEREAVSRVAAKYQDKKKVKTKDGDEMIVYEYSDRQIAERNKSKAEQIEKLRGSIDKLRAQYRKDLKSPEEKVRYTALAIGLMDETFERVGNDQSAKDGHFGVTGWRKKHVKFSGGKATITYVGKSGVDHVKEVKDSALVKALKDATKGKEDNDPLCEGEDCRITAEDVNAYLKPFDVSAKDIRGYHANTTMQEQLKAARSKGGKLPTDKKEREKKLKAEFKAALEATAEAVGHEAATLRSQYLTPGLEDEFLKDGKVTESLVKKVATKSRAEKEDEQVSDMVRPAPKHKPPRHDLRKDQIKEDDPDISNFGAEDDRDLSLNYKRVAYLWVTGANKRQQKKNDKKVTPKAPPSASKPSEPEHKPGEVWKTDKGFAAKNPEGVTHSFQDRVQAEAYAKGKEEVAKTPKNNLTEGGIPADVQKELDRLDQEPEAEGDELKNPEDKALNDAVKKDKAESANGGNAELEALAKSLDSGVPKDIDRAVAALKKAQPDLSGEIDKQLGLYQEATRALAKAFRAMEMSVKKQDKEESAAALKAAEDSRRAVSDAIRGMAKGQKDSPDLDVAEKELKDLAEGDAPKTETTKAPESPTPTGKPSKAPEKPSKAPKPFMMGGTPVEPVTEPQSDDQLSAFAKHALNTYLKATPEDRQAAAADLAKRLSSLPAKSPERDQLERIGDGLQMAAILNGKGESEMLVGGKPLRPRHDPSFVRMAQALHKNGKAEILMGSQKDFYGPKGRKVVEEAMATMSDEDLGTVSAANMDLKDALLDPKTPKAHKEILRSLIRRQLLNGMLVSHQIIENALTKDGKGEERGTKKKPKRTDDEVKAAVRERTNQNPKYKRALEILLNNPSPETQKASDLAWIEAELESMAAEVTLSERDPKVIQMRRALEIQDPLELDALYRWQMDAEDKDELQQAFKDGIPDKKTPQEILDDFLKDAKPETRERLKGTTPDEFLEILGGIMGDSVSPGDKTATYRRRRLTWI